MKARVIAAVTGSRAEYGHLRPILKHILSSAGLRLRLIVTGSHLSSRFGLTVREIEKDGIPIAFRVKIPLTSDTAMATAHAMGMAMMGFSKAYARLKPDILVVLGDRSEIHAATSAAVPFRIPVAHIHGGEITEGAQDEQFRHSITKLSHIHFPSSDVYRRRIISMGEDGRLVFNYGAPGLDDIRRRGLVGRKDLLHKCGIPRDMKLGVLTFHPATLQHEDAARHDIDEVLAALSDIKGVYWVFTGSNQDAGGRVINARIRRFVEGHRDASSFHISLGRRDYLSMLKHADIMVGNSSSGIIEAPEFELPVVNIGARQKGRMRGINVIDVKGCRAGRISAAIKRGLSQKFKRSLEGMRNPYKGRDASMRIVKKLKSISIDGLASKKFNDRSGVIRCCR